MNYRGSLFLLSCLILLKAGFPARAQARRCRVYAYTDCRTKCRSKAWRRTPRRCHWLRQLRQSCPRRYHKELRRCHNRWSLPPHQKGWIRRQARKKACFRQAHQAYLTCLRQQKKKNNYNQIAPQLRWYCKKRCGRWRWRCVRLCVSRVVRYCKAWARPIGKRTRRCYKRCKKKYCLLCWRKKPVRKRR